MTDSVCPDCGSEWADDEGHEGCTNPYCDRWRFAPVADEATQTTAPSFTCPRCGAVSYNLTDVIEGYCGRCHDWTRDPERVTVYDEHGEPSEIVVRTKTGRVLTDADLMALAEEAEEGYDISHLLPNLETPEEGNQS